MFGYSDADSEVMKITTKVIHYLFMFGTKISHNIICIFQIDNFKLKWEKVSTKNVILDAKLSVPKFRTQRYLKHEFIALDNMLVCMLPGREGQLFIPGNNCFVTMLVPSPGYSQGTRGLTTWLSTNLRELDKPIKYQVLVIFAL